MYLKRTFRFFILCLFSSFSVVSYGQEKARFEWAKAFSGTTTESGFAVTTDLSGNVITTGRLFGSTDADPGPGVVTLTSGGATDFFVSKLNAQGNFVWAFRIGGSADEMGRGIKTDAGGNIYISGEMNLGTTVDFNPGAGTFNLTSAGSYDGFIMKVDPSGNFLWAVRYGSTGTDNTASIDVDPSGNVYATGYFTGTVDFDPGPGTFNMTMSGSADSYVSKFDTNGNFIWAKRIAANTASRELALDASGSNVHVTGVFSGTSDFDPGAGTFNMTAPGSSNDIFISKLTSDGNFVWARQVGGANTESAEAIEVDASGNIYTTGGYLGTTDFDPGAGTFNLTSLNPSVYNDAFVLKLDQNGNFGWVYSVTGNDDEYGSSIALDGDGNIYATGQFSLTADFDPGPGYKTFSTNGSNMFIVKLTPAGSLAWAANLGGSNSEVPHGLTCDINNNVIATGFFSGTPDFNPEAPIVNLTGAGNEVFIVKLSSKITTVTGSSFDTSADGWTTVTAVSPPGPTPIYSTTGGNPGGMIGAQDLPAGASLPLSYFRAPSGFIGNLCSSYGKTLTYDIQQTTTRPYVAAPNVIISNGLITLEYRPTVQVYPAIAPGWTTYTVPLIEGPEWLNFSSGSQATKDEMKSVLCAVTRLDIRGRYGSTPDGFGRLDNPSIEKLSTLPPPVITSFTPASAIPGATLTITGTGFDPTAVNNIVYFGSIQGTVTTASATQLQVTVPKGARYGTITVLNNTTSLIGQSLKNFDPAFTDGGRIIPASLKPRQEINLGAATGNISAGLQLADVDNDGWVDIITTESFTGISIFRNLGTGGALTPASFAPKVILSQANGKLRVGDMDGDGRQDIAVLYSITFGYVTFYRNTSSPGSISFVVDDQLQSPSTNVRDIQLTDLDGDGRLDLLQSFWDGCSPGGYAFGVWQGISTPGNIELCAYRNFDQEVFCQATEITVGDFNNDNKPDVAVASFDNQRIHILQNTSTYGTISLGVPFQTALNVVRGRVQVADFNNDNKLDLAWRSNTTNSVRIRTNTNTGGTLVAADFATELILQSSLTGTAGFEGELAVADINGDSKPDILGTDDNDFGIFENVHTGGALTASSFSFYEYQGPGATARPASPETADLNGDGKPDIVFGTLSNGTQAKIVISENINAHTPVISLTTVSPLKGPVGSTVTITGDYFSTTPSQNIVYFGPAKATVLTATKNTLTVSVPAGGTHAPVSVTANELTAQYHLPFNVAFSTGSSFAASSFRPPVSFSLTSAELDVEVADLNDDNKPDVVAEGFNNDTYIFRNTHSTTNISASSLTANGSVLIADAKLTDLNGDSKPDLYGETSIFRNSHVSGSAITFDAATPVAGSTALTGSADLNLDGRPEIVGTSGAAGSAHENQSRLGSFTSGTFTTLSGSANSSYTKAAAGGYTVAADFNNDGFVDMASTNPTTDNFTVWKSNGEIRVTSTLMTASGDVSTGDLPQRIYSGDLDVDGKVDLVVLYGSTGTSGALVSIFRNQSTTSTITFARQDFTPGPLAGPATIADLDGDGKPEIIVTHQGANTFTIFKNISVSGTINETSFTPAVLPVTAPRAVTAGDINSDGRLDLIFTSAPNSLIVLENAIPFAAISFTSQPAPASACEGGIASFSVTATGDNNLVYQWQVDNGGFVNLTNDAVYSGVNSNTLTITGAPLALNGKSYRVLVHGDATLNTTSAVASLTLDTRTAQPVVTSSVTPVGNTISICSGDVTLTAPAGFSSYLWSTSATSQQITTSQAGSYTVQVTGTNGCISIASSALDVVINTALCNIPPVINPDTVFTQIEGKVNFDLSVFISDTDNNLDFSTLKIISQPTSGAIARIEGNNLVIDYSGKNFSGPDHIIIEICDLAGSCTQEEIIINVIGDIYVYNAVSPNNDAKNDFLFLQYIDALESTRKNHVSIFNRWGDKVYEAENYDNAKVKFEGKNSNGNDLPSGTYFFKIDFFGKPKRGQKTGYFSLKR